VLPDARPDGGHVQHAAAAHQASTAAHGQARDLLIPKFEITYQFEGVWSDLKYAGASQQAHRPQGLRLLLPWCQYVVLVSMNLQQRGERLAFPLLWQVMLLAVQHTLLQYAL